MKIFVLQVEVEFMPIMAVLKWGIPSCFGALYEIGLLLDHYMMGGICSRKREQLVMVDGGCRGVSERFCKIASSKWLGNSFSRPIIDCQPGRGKCPPLMDLCVYKIREVYILALFGMWHWVCEFVCMDHCYLIVLC